MEHTRQGVGKDQVMGLVSECRVQWGKVNVGHSGEVGRAQVRKIY